MFRKSWNFINHYEIEAGVDSYVSKGWWSASYNWDTLFRQNNITSVGGIEFYIARVDLGSWESGSIFYDNISRSKCCANVCTTNWDEIEVLDDNE